MEVEECTSAAGMSTTEIASWNLPFPEGITREREFYYFDNWYCRAGCFTSLNHRFAVRRSLNGRFLRNHAFSHLIQESDGVYCRSSQWSDDIPEIVLLKIFRMLHPIDRINGASLVCKRWNRLVYSGVIWDDVRVSIWDHPHEDCVRNFLEKVAKSLKKLCVYISPALMETGLYCPQLEEFLPLYMPNLELLDLGGVRGITKMTLLMLDRRLPNLKRLNLEDLQEGSLREVLLRPRTFRQLRELQLLGTNFSIDDFEILLQKFLSLEVLGIDNLSSLPPVVLHNRNAAGERKEIIAANLKRLYVRCLCCDYFASGMEFFENLTFLSMNCCSTDIADRFLLIRGLKNLEHLHLSEKNGKEARYEAGILMQLFEPSDDISTFPGRLKYLAIPYHVNLGDEIIEKIVSSCPDLQALNVAQCSRITGDGFLRIVKSLTELKYLDVSANAAIANSAAFDKISFNDVPNLEYLSMDITVLSVMAEECNNDSTESDSSAELLKAVRRCAVQRPHLIRPRLIIADGKKSFLAFRQNIDGVVFDVTLFRCVSSIEKELLKREGFCCMSSVG